MDARADLCAQDRGLLRDAPGLVGGMRVFEALASWLAMDDDQVDFEPQLADLTLRIPDL